MAGQFQFIIVDCWSLFSMVLLQARLYECVHVVSSKEICALALSHPEVLLSVNVDKQRP